VKKLACFLLLSAALAAKDNSVSKTEAEEGWVLLFDGESLLGWTAQTPTAWRVEGGLLAPSADAGVLRSNSPFADFAARFDYRASSPDADCSVVLRTALDGDPKQTGFELQIGDAHADWPTGSIVDLFKARPLRPEANQWHTIDATLSGDHITVKLDGYSVADGRSARSHAGFIALSCAKGARMQFRNIRLKPLDMKTLFNGNDLSGWKVVNPPPPKKVGVFKKMIGGGENVKEAVWSVAKQMVHVEKGSGQLETAAMYDDFVLQLAMRVNARDRTEHPKNAVFFRGDAGQLFTGYEVQSGSLVDLQPARKILAADNEFFTQTIVARGRHIQVWVDGVPVSDFQDTRAEGTVPRKDARTNPGTISLQAYDEKSNHDFRSIQVLSLPKIFGKAPAQLTASTLVPLATPPASGQAAGAPLDPNRPQVQQLMARALGTTDPEQQAGLYTQILLLEPNNPVAFTGRQQAQQKIDEAKAKKTKEEETRTRDAQTQAETQQTGLVARQQAEDALLAGNLSRAQTLLSAAERVLPGDQKLAVLRTRLDQAVSTQDRLRYALTGAGALALVGTVVLFIRTRGKKEAYLEVVEGVEKGKRYTLDQEIIHIGAIAQDGGNKNEVVVKDLERMISRFHCEVHTRGKQVFLIDCGSANGTKLDRKRVSAGKAVRVKKGGRIDLAGTCVLKLGMEKRKNA